MSSARRSKRFRRGLEQGAVFVWNEPGFEFPEFIYGLKIVLDDDHCLFLTFDSVITVTSDRESCYDYQCRDATDVGWLLLG